MTPNYVDRAGLFPFVVRAMACLILAGCGGDDSPGIPEPEPKPEPEPSAPARLETDLPSLFFNYGADSLGLDLTNTGEDSLSWSASTNVQWCRPNEAQGILGPGEVHHLMLRSEREDLETGLFQGSLDFETHIGQKVMVPLSLRNYHENLFLLDMKPWDVEYDLTLDLIVMVGEDMSYTHGYFRLYVVDPWNHTVTEADLNRQSFSLSVDPAGGRAAVGQDNFVTYLDIRTMEVIRQYPVDFRVGEIILAGNGWIYFLPDDNLTWVKVHCLEIETGLVHEHIGTDLIDEVSQARMHPAGKSFYVARSRSLHRFDIRGGVAEPLRLSSDSVDAPFDGLFWFIKGGARILFGKGTVFSTAESGESTLQYYGSLHTDPYFSERLRWADPISSSGQLLVVTQTSWRVFDEENLRLTYMRDLPGFFSGGYGIGGEIRPSQSRWGFCRSTGDSVVLLIEDYTAEGRWATAAVALEEM